MDLSYRHKINRIFSLEISKKSILSTCEDIIAYLLKDILNIFLIEIFLINNLQSKMQFFFYRQYFFRMFEVHIFASNLFTLLRRRLTEPIRKILVYIIVLSQFNYCHT